jgi:hypothetical protein
MVRLMLKIQFYWDVMLVMCHIPGDFTVQQFRCENLKFHKGIISPNILAYFQLMHELLSL